MVMITISALWVKNEVMYDYSLQGRRTHTMENHEAFQNLDLSMILERVLLWIGCCQEAGVTL